MRIPGEWEPRRSSAVNPADAVTVKGPAAAAVTRDSDPPTPRRGEMATWLEVTIVVVALLIVMFLAMRASRSNGGLTLRHGASEDVAARVEQLRAPLAAVFESLRA
jgi:hypothetical protein